MSCQQAECIVAKRQVEQLRAALRKALGALQSAHKAGWEVRVAKEGLEALLDGELPSSSDKSECG